MVEIVRLNYKENREAYEHIKQQLQEKLGDGIAIYQVGSTALPNMLGENSIDILVGAKTKEELVLLTKKIASLGYFPCEDTETKEYRFFTSRKEETTSSDVHIHLAIQSTKRFQDFLILKDYLLRDRKARSEYKAYKIQILEKYGTDRSQYRDRKSPFVTELLKRANEYNKQAKPLELILVRHGENIDDPSLANDQLPLSETGIRQAKWAAEMLHFDFDVIITAPSKRTQETADIISRGQNHLIDSRLVERGWGNSAQNETETDEEAEIRFQDFLDDISKEFGGQKVLIVTHGSLMKIAQNVIEKTNQERGRIDNCSIIKYSRIGESVLFKDYEIKMKSDPFDDSFENEFSL